MSLFSSIHLCSTFLFIPLTEHASPKNLLQFTSNSPQPSYSSLSENKFPRKTIHPFRSLFQSTTARTFRPSIPRVCKTIPKISLSLQRLGADRSMAPAIPALPHGEHFAEVVVVRHGETEWNVSHTVQGRLDHELNETGRQQAAKVARRLSQEVKPAAVYSSDLKRAAETAQTIATAFCVQPKLLFDQALIERHMGLFQGMKKHDAIKTKEYKAYSSNDDRNEKLPGGGESLNQLSDRCVPFLNAIAEKHKGERVIVVSHEEVIQEICRHADPTSSDRRKIPNTSITVVHISGSDGRWILEKVGDISHLSEDSFPERASVMNQQSEGGKKRGHLKVESEETKEDSNSNSEEQDNSATRAVRAKF